MSDWKRQAGSVGPDEPTEGCTMRERAARAELAVKTFSQHEDGECSKGYTRDLLTDLRHLCDREGWDFAALLDKSESMYLCDIDNKEYED